ncbi:hypothetical protein HYPSUDRAFT_37528 [Hypholoma sublateritium FD-334 SS-4]|uniref:F-box domain-containing protein n=1 Tax=Hypholoma sublateritium (strain FD-334 SS-4) TaxID=945553 RepID=A0A0D2MNN6_HYPSF|nr:hypothetical protein HYPSUDRAFT_37528 [Hypholoma sublateritium FD-334 SS-4]
MDKLEMHDLLSCSTVSRQLRRIIAQSSRLQYSIELEKARMVSLTPSSYSLSFAARLKLLRERERNWKYLDWKQRHTLSLPPTGSVYEFVGGLYGNGTEDGTRATASISFLELPSLDATILGRPKDELKAWTHSMEDVNIIDFTMDPSQDLLVLVALAPRESTFVYKLHLRSIKTNEPHRRAPLHVLPCWPKPAAGLLASELVSVVRVQVSGNLVALLIKEMHGGGGAHLEIWNWNTHPQYSCALTRSTGIDDFTFLTHDTFLVVHPAGRFEVYTFINPSICKYSTTPLLRVTYSLPQLSPGYAYWYMSMSSNPSPGHVPRQQQVSEIGNKNQMYYPQPEERIHACCAYIFNPDTDENAQLQSFVFFLNLKTLLNPPTEWIDRIKAVKSTPYRRNRELTYPIASSSSSASSSPVRSPSPFYVEFELPESLPFFPPHQDNIRLSPQYPLFPTFDEQRSPDPAHRILLYRQLPDAKPSLPPQRQNSRLATSPIASIPPNTKIPWDVWGPQSTRWFEECRSTDWQHAIYGLRSVDSIDPNHNMHRSNTVNINPMPPPANTLVAATTSRGTGSGSSSILALSSQPNGHTGGAVASSSSAATTADSPVGQATLQALETSEAGDQSQGQGEGTAPAPEEHADDDSDAPPTRRYLRMRDFNPYVFVDGESTSVCSAKAKKIDEAAWREPHLVTEPSTMHVKGVFTKDIVSALPYMEIISKDMFEVTDVMMDDCRLLLLQRGEAGKLKRVEVLML